MDNLPHPPSAISPSATAPRPAGRERGSSRLPILLLLLLGVIVLAYFPTLLQRVEYYRTKGQIQALRETLPEANLRSLSKEFTLIYQKIKPSVVHIDTRREIHPQRNNFFGGGFFNGQPGTLEEEGEASGVIVDADGYIVTNYHVVEEATDVNVVLYDGRTFLAEVVGRDPGIDLAVLKIDAPRLIAASWGDSDKLEVGEMVWAIGSPYGLDQTITSGIVSAKGRRGVSDNLYQDFLQTDVAINPGNSGGPLVDVGGDIVGINSAIFGPTYQGISFAIPSNLAREAYEQIRKDGKVIRGYLGVQLRPMTAAARMELPADFTGGAAVQIVHPDSPAEKAGIKKGDVIVKWNGQPVSSDGELRLMIARTPINGAAVPVTLYRNGKELTIEVQVGVRPEVAK